LIRFHA
jgi:hypothetical protein